MYKELFMTTYVKDKLSVRPIFSPQIASTILNVKQKTLINYEKMVDLSINRSHTNRRIYSEQDLYMITIVRYMIETYGMSSRSIKLLTNILQNASKKQKLDNLIETIIPKQISTRLIDQIRDNN